MNEALDDILTESGDEEEENAIVNQVLDEIGIEVAAKVLHTAKKVHFNYLMTILNIFFSRSLMRLPHQKAKLELKPQRRMLKTKKLKIYWPN